LAIIKVGKIRSLTEIEQVISEIESASDDDRFVFSVDSLIARHGPMYDASRLQLVVTLARHRLQSNYLDVHPKSSRDSVLEGLCSYSPGIAAIRLSRGIRIDKIEVDRREALSAATEKMQATDAEKYSKVIQGRSLDLICVSGSKVQYLRQLFIAAGIVKESEDMKKTMRDLVGFVGQRSKDKIPNSLVNALGVFSSELMQNTQEHAVTNHAGKPYIGHVEGMIFGWTRYTADLFAKDFSGNSSLQDYWAIEAGKTENGVTSLRAFEVSYFDSGPGLVSRFKSTPITEMTIEKEREYFLECLKHKATSKHEDAAGEGLPLVLGELKKVGGLIRIRSGRLSMFNVFKQGGIERNIFNFEDWSDSPLAAVEGAVISIIVPLRRE